MNNKVQKAKTKLIELGYIDNEWLARYLEMLEANLETPRDRKSTQAHHAIPVSSYWISDEPYDRKEALKASRRDSDNFEVHLLYKDHLLIHSYLTMCTDLAETQRRYEAQADLRKHNSAKTKESRIEGTVISNKARVGMKYTKRESTEERATHILLDKRLTPVKCVELNKTFASISEASKALNINKNCIISCVRGRTRTAGQYHWALV